MAFSFLLDSCTTKTAYTHLVYKVRIVYISVEGPTAQAKAIYLLLALLVPARIQAPAHKWARVPVLVQALVQALAPVLVLVLALAQAQAQARVLAQVLAQALAQALAQVPVLAGVEQGRSSLVAV